MNFILELSTSRPKCAGKNSAKLSINAGASLLFGIFPDTESEVTNVAEIKRKKGESFESLVRRFNRKVQQSGKQIQTRKIRFHKPDKSRNLQRDSALRRMEIRKMREYLKKIGRLEEDTRRR